MKKFILGLIFGGVCTAVFLVASQAWAEPKTMRLAENCKPKTLKGRWMAYFDGPTFCTLDIREDGTIRKTQNAITKCKGDIRGHILGGELTLNAPLESRHGLNQCWITGYISTKKGRIEIFQASITISGDQFTGIFTDFLSPIAGRFTAVKY